MKSRPCLLAILLLFVPIPGFSAGINTNVALPVAQGSFVLRYQGRSTWMDGGTRVFALPVVLAYGVTPSTTGMAVQPYVFLRRPDDSTASGLGDPTFLLRQTVLHYDAPRTTSRLALIAGVAPDWGATAVRAGGTGYLAGAVYTLQKERWEFDADSLYRRSNSKNGFRPGDFLSYDVAVQWRLSPAAWPETGVPAQWNLVLEFNGTTEERARQGGAGIADSGGTILRLSPGLQYVTQRFIFEASLLIPVVRNLNGKQPTERLGASLGLRTQF